jgi:hypothetical protein
VRLLRRSLQRALAAAQLGMGPLAGRGLSFHVLRSLHARPLSSAATHRDDFGQSDFLPLPRAAGSDWTAALDG